MAAFTGFEDSILEALGAPKTAQNRLFVRLWQRAEGGSADFNPFNTTQPAPGAHNYNSVGVKEYRSPQQGLKATVDTLTNGKYNALVSLLKSGHATAKQEATALADSPWGTGSGVLRLLGSGRASYSRNSGASPQTRAVGQTLGSPTSQQLVGNFLLEQAQAALSGKAPTGSDLLSLALARKALGSAVAPDSHASTVHPTSGTRTTMTRAKVPIIGATGHEDPLFLHNLGSAVAAVGGTQIRVISGERSPAHNAAVGGVAHSNHLPDAKGNAHALDGEAFIPGKGWVPLGAALAGVAGKFRLRSGDQPGFFNGQPDPNHVDDGFNQA